VYISIVLFVVVIVVVKQLY